MARDAKAGAGGAETPAFGVVAEQHVGEEPAHERSDDTQGEWRRQCSWGLGPVGGFPGGGGRARQEWATVTRTTSASLAGLALVALVALAACGSSDGAALTRGVPAGGPRPTIPTVTTAVFQGPPASAPAKPTCELVTAADVGKAVGNAVRTGTGDPKFCFWGTLVDGGTSVDATVGIPAAGRGAQACAVQKLSLPKESSQEALTAGAANAVWAYQQVSVLVQGILVACFPDAIVRIGLTGERDQTALRQTAVALAETIHGRL
jgi:hypothetical protein